MFKILIAEDDPHLRRLLTLHLQQNGFEAIPCADGISAWERFGSEHVDLLITDVMMPRMDGNRLAAKVRDTNKDLPILMLTALESFEDKEKGFTSGSDDYMVKPVDLKELVLRIKALLRRYRITNENRIEHKCLVLEYASFQVTVHGKNVEMTKKEFLLLYKLASNPGIIFTRDQLLDEIWGFDTESLDRTVDTHVKRIREKINCEDIEIQTVRGLGYKVVMK
jgi:DNA-binding response OmpR family regulator